MGSSSVVLGLEGAASVARVLGGVVGGEVEGSMTMRSSVGWRACSDIVLGCSWWRVRDVCLEARSVGVWWCSCEYLCEGKIWLVGVGTR